MKTTGSPLIFGVVAALTITCSSAELEKTERVSHLKPRLIEPGVCVGEIRAGMSEKQVTSALGQPDEIVGPSPKGFTVLGYSKTLGFSVIIEKSGLAVSVMCGGETDDLVNRFTGRTKEGIGMRSSKSDILKVFGQPKETERLKADEEVLCYPRQGIRFRIKNGKVIHITVNFLSQGAA